MNLIMATTTSQQLQNVGFGKKQADAIAAGYDKLSHKMEEMSWQIARLIQSQSETDSKLAAHMARMDQFQSDTSRKLDEHAARMDRMAQSQSETDSRLTERMDHMIRSQTETERKVSEQMTQMMAQMIQAHTNINARIDGTNNRIDDLKDEITGFKLHITKMFWALVIMAICVAVASQDGVVPSIMSFLSLGRLS